MNFVRAFIAVEISPSLKEKLHKETAPLRRTLTRPLVRWVDVGNIHLTLKFLGDTPVDKLELLKGYLVKEVASQDPFEIAVNGIGVFASFDRPSVIWAGVKDNGQLSSLYRCVEAAASRMGSEPERRRFSPHLTLGRVKQRPSQAEREKIRLAVQAHETLVFGKMQVDAVHLFESQLKPTGAVYRSLFTVRLES